MHIAAHSSEGRVTRLKLLNKPLSLSLSLSQAPGRPPLARRGTSGANTSKIRPSKRDAHVHRRNVTQVTDWHLEYRGHNTWRTSDAFHFS